MDWFKELKIAHKLNLLVIIASAFILLTSSIGYFFNMNTSKSLDKIYSENLIAIGDLGDLKGNVNGLLADTLNLFQNISPSEKQALLEDMKELRANSSKLFEEFSNANPSDQTKAKMEEFKEIRANFWKKMNPAIALAKANQNQAGFAIYRANVENLRSYRQSLVDLETIQKEESKQTYDACMKASATANILLLVVGLSSLTLMICLGLIISNGITNPIKKAINELTAGSSEVSAASSQVEAASQSLAEGTTEQAASIQETSSTLEETSSMVQQNSDNTKQAVVLAKNAKDYAEKSNSEMSVMMTSMENLKQSSNEIAKIIKVIDEIAFQTNLLSLNAAVEAARAGEAGKGFAVVAEEVRNLAQRSAQAAKDTASIIENNISLSEGSVEIAKNVNESLTHIDAESRKVSELLEEISTATEEQARGINEINKAIRQMEQVMQNNAKTADESSSASKELACQAENVNDIVHSLIKLVEGAHTANLSSQLLITKTKKTYQPKPVAVHKSSAVAVSRTNNHPEEIIPLNDF